MKGIKSGIIGATLLATAAGCSTTPERHSAVEQARSDYESLASEAHIQQHAAQQLSHAEDAVSRAEAAARAGADEEAINHYLYLADRRMDIVEEAAKHARAEQIVQNADAQRQDILLERREAQVDRAESRADLAEVRAQRLEQSLAELEEELDSLQAEQHEDNIVLTLQDSLFISNDAEFMPGAETALDNIAQFLNRHEDQQLEVHGHSDSSGTPSENQILSERRARAVQDALVERGVDRSRITSEGFGADDPVATNQTVNGRQQNRRVEIIIETADQDRVTTR